MTNRHTFLEWVFERYPELFFEWLEEFEQPLTVMEMLEVQEEIDSNLEEDAV